MGGAESGGLVVGVSSVGWLKDTTQGLMADLETKFSWVFVMGKNPLRNQGGEATQIAQETSNMSWMLKSG